MYDPDAITITHELVGDGTYTLVDNSDVKYVVGVSIQQSKDLSTSWAYCGTNIFVRNYGKDFPYNQVHVRCTDPIVFQKTGNDSATIVLTYIPRDISIVATPSATLVEFGQNTAVGMQGISYILFIGLALLLLIQSINLGTWFMKKKL